MSGLTGCGLLKVVEGGHDMLSCFGEFLIKCRMLGYLHFIVLLLKFLLG